MPWSASLQLQRPARKATPCALNLAHSQQHARQFRWALQTQMSACYVRTLNGPMQTKQNSLQGPPHPGNICFHENLYCSHQTSEEDGLR